MASNVTSNLGTNSCDSESVVFSLASFAMTAIRWSHSRAAVILECHDSLLFSRNCLAGLSLLAFPPLGSQCSLQCCDSPISLTEVRPTELYCQARSPAISSRGNPPKMIRCDPSPVQMPDTNARMRWRSGSRQCNRRRANAGHWQRAFHHDAHFHQRAFRPLPWRFSSQKG